MNWHTFFDFSTMAHRHLVFVYAGIWAVQAGYVSWIGWNWFHTRSPRTSARAHNENN